MKLNIRKSWHLLTTPNFQNKAWSVLCFIALLFKTTELQIYWFLLCMIFISAVIIKEYIKHLKQLERKKIKIIVDEIKKELKIDAHVTVNKFVNLGDVKEK